MTAREGGQTSDVELARRPPNAQQLDGYPSFADFIARDCDAAIYRKFGHLSARNLLYLQSELHSLEQDLRALDAEDTADITDKDAQKAAREWRYFSDAMNPRAQQHRQLQAQIQVKLKEYHQALILESQVLALRAPDSRTLGAFKTWFWRLKSGKSLPALWGRDRSLYDDTSDLVALAPGESDRLSFILQRYFGWLFRKERVEVSQIHGRSLGLFYYPRHRIQFAGAIISIFFSAILLIGAIVCLLSTSNSSNSLRIGIIVLFTCIFALVVGLLTNARRAEIFGATAAYSAVLVVFVGNNLGNLNTNSGYN